MTRPPRSTRRLAPRALWVSVVLPLLLLSSIIGGVRVYSYLSMREAVTRYVERDLEAIASQKAVWIEQWLAARRDDAELIMTLHLTRDLHTWLRSDRKSGRAQKHVVEQLQFPHSTHIRGASLHSVVDGHTLLSTIEPAEQGGHAELALRAAQTRKPVLQDLYRKPEDEGPGVDMAYFMPIVGEDKTVLAVLRIEIDPAVQLYPQLQTWPGSSDSGEVLLMRLEGDAGLVLNPLRHTGAAPLTMRCELLSGRVCARALRGGPGFYQDADLRGVPSLAYGLPVAGTPWVVLAKVNRAEAYAQLDTVTLNSVGLLSALLVACAWWLVAHRRAEVALKRAYEEIEDLYQNAPCGYHSIDRHGVFRRINDTELRMLGYARDEVVDRLSILDLMDEANRRIFHANMPHLIDQGTTTDLALQLRRKDGTVLPVLINATAIRDARGQFLTSRSMVVDISERSRIQAVQERVNRILRVISQCSMVMSAATDEPYLLNAICHLLRDSGGYAMVWIGLTGDDPQRTVHPVSHAGLDADALQGLQVSCADDTRDTSLLSLALRARTIQVNPDAPGHPELEPWRSPAMAQRYQASIALPLEHAGKVFGVLAIYAQSEVPVDDEIILLDELANTLAIGVGALRARDARSRAEKDLQLLWRAFEESFNAFVITEAPDDPAHNGFRIVYVNPAFEKITGYTAAEVQGKSPGLLLRAGAAEQPGLTELNQALREQRDCRVTLESCRKDGTPFWNELLVSPVRDDHGRVTHYIGVTSDVTEQRRAEQQLRESKDQLQKLMGHLQSAREKERAHIAREMHDELGQILTALKMDIVGLRGRIPPDSAATAQLEGMTALVDATLGTVRRISSDLRPTMLDDLGLKAAVEWLVEDFGKRYQPVRCSLVCDLGGCHIDGEHAIAAYRIVQECLTNVSRHAQATKVHVMMVVRDATRLQISVQDDGQGLPPPRPGAREGFGLIGMRTRVDALGGTLCVESLPGEGVSVDVSIPLKQTVDKETPP